ncbi:hypothetical protein HZ326_8726 [Fusarium oxysporum f. sp. albedinis]|nr:hypothetical protein HZ326_8726 [Fusarium oxysporum f. sp. albedinis]
MNLANCTEILRQSLILVYENLCADSFSLPSTSGTADQRCTLGDPAAFTRWMLPAYGKFLHENKLDNVEYVFGKPKPATVEQQIRELHKLPEAGNTVDTIV